MTHRRGVTFLEAVFAVALLAITIGAIVSAYSSVREMTLRDEQRLSATEVAHRVILIYTNEGPDKVPPTTQAIEYGRDRYRFNLREEALLEDERAGGDLSVRIAVPASTLSVNRQIEARLMLITVDVFREMSGPIPHDARPIASLSRVIDPLDTSNLPDDVLLRHIERILGAQGGLVPGGGAPR